MKLKSKSITIVLLALAAAIAPAFARIGEDEKELEARYGKPEKKAEGADGTVVLGFRQEGRVIRATLWKGKTQQMGYFSKGPLAEERLKELLAENAPAEEWERKGNLHIAAKAKLEAEEKDGGLVIQTLDFKDRQAAAPAADKPKEAAAAYIGLTVEEAGKRAEAAGLKWRVVMEDGVGKPTTRDYRPDRLNFTVEKGKVTAVRNG